MVYIHVGHVHAVMVGSITPHQRPDRPTHRRDDAERNQRVHGGCAMTRIHGGSFVERCR